MFYTLNKVVWLFTNSVHLFSFLQISYNVDNIDSPSMLDKFTRSRFTPSLLQVGTKPAVGWIAVTSTGLVRRTLCGFYHGFIYFVLYFLNTSRLFVVRCGPAALIQVQMVESWECGFESRSWRLCPPARHRTIIIYYCYY